MLHRLKIEPQYLLDLVSKAKKAELRLNDRAYRVNDLLGFESDSSDRVYLFTITHIHAGLGLKKDFVCLSLDPVIDFSR